MFIRAKSRTSASSRSARGLRLSLKTGSWARRRSTTPAIGSGCGPREGVGFGIGLRGRWEGQALDIAWHEPYQTLSSLSHCWSLEPHLRGAIVCSTRPPDAVAGNENAPGSTRGARLQRWLRSGLIHPTHAAARRSRRSRLVLLLLDHDASVVSSRPAIDAAFCSAVRVTLVGSMTPAFTRSS